MKHTHGFTEPADVGLRLVWRSAQRGGCEGTAALPLSQRLPRIFRFRAASRSEPIGHGRAAADYRYRSNASNDGRWPFAEQAPCPAVNTAMGSAADVAARIASRTLTARAHGDLRHRAAAEHRLLHVSRAGVRLHNSALVCSAPLRLRFRLCMQWSRRKTAMRHRSEILAQ